MSILYAILLGIIQGLTEFIPVSSTAHLLIAQKLLGIPADDSVFSFLVIIQLGTLVSLFFFYAKDLTSIIQGVLQFQKPSQERELGVYIIIATIPALVIGFLLKDLVEILFKTPLLEAAIRLLTAAILLFLAERFTSKKRNLGSITWLDALVVGLFQILAIFPGASRSGSTISGGMFRGLDRPSAARFAFLISVPVMLAAGGYETLKMLKMADLSTFLPVLVVGFASAAITGWFAIRWLISYLGKHSLYVFSGYCAVLGSIALIFHFIYK